MASRTGFDFVQKTLSNSIEKITNYFDERNFIGINNKWYCIYTSIFGSLDYFHLVSFPLSGMYSYNHPMYLDEASDGNLFGYINADLTEEGKEAYISDGLTFDVNWAYCPNGAYSYPIWDGWGGGTDPYPMYGADRMIVFLKGMLIRVDSSALAGHTRTFIVDATRMIGESLRPSDYYDIRVYRFDSAANDPSLGWIPSGAVYELNRNISGTDLIIQVGANVTQTIPNNEPRFFMIFWESPDDYCATLLPTPTIPNDITAFLTFNSGNTPQARCLFDTNRYDLVDFKNQGGKFIKNINSTRYELIDGNSQNYGEPNPLIYRLPAMNGSLDPFYSSGIPYIGNIWGYGFSVDQGVDNPEEGVYQGVIICFRTSAGEDTEMQVLTGPIVPYEFMPANPEDFYWYPSAPEEYEIFAKIIVRIMSDTSESSYRPRTFIDYLHYEPSYGNDKISNDNYFSFMYGNFIERPFIPNYLETVLSPLFIPLIYMTPVTNSRVGGMHYNSLYLFNMDDVGDIYNIYWKIPVQHPLVDLSDYVPVDNLYTFMNNNVIQEYGQLEMSEYIRKSVSQMAEFQFSTILGFFYADDTNSNFGTVCYNNKNIYTPSKLEIHLPIINSCHEYIEEPKLKYDYSFRFNFKSINMDYIKKDLFLSASKYYIEDDQAEELVSLGLDPGKYLWPSKLNSINEWVMYGRTSLIPDLVGGEDATIEMRQFKPRDPTLPLYDEFVADLRIQYADDLNSGDPFRIKRANENILDAISDQEYLYGGFDNPDTRTLSDLIYSMDDFSIGVSLYNTTGIPIWDSSISFWGGDPAFFDIDTGISDPRYGFAINGSWYIQSFTESIVSDARNTYIQEHPISYYILKEQDNDLGTPNNTFALNNSRFALASTFSADFADVYDKIYKVKLKLRIKNVPTANLILTINETNPINEPTNILQTSDPISYTSLSGEFEWVEFNFRTPYSLTKDERYSLVLTSEDPFGEYRGVSDIDTIEWAFANVDSHSYGITETNSLLTNSVVAGESELTVMDGSVFSATPFYIKIGPEVFEVTSLTGNILTLNGTLQNDYDSSTPIYEVVFVPADSERRWVYRKTGDVYDWQDVSGTVADNYDATYQLYREIDEVGLVTAVPNEEWFGADISPAKTDIDAFYISASTDSYYIPTDDYNYYFYGSLPGLDPFAGFNVANSYDFPPVNTWRASYTNLVDGFICWSSKEVDSPVQLSIFPLAIDNFGVQYIPTKNDMYVTVICKKINGEKKVINKLVPAGTSSPILLDSDYFIGVDLLWVDPAEFKEDPFYGYGPAEAFVIRSE